MDEAKFINEKIAERAEKTMKVGRKVGGKPRLKAFDAWMMDLSKD